MRNDSCGARALLPLKSTYGLRRRLLEYDVILVQKRPTRNPVAPGLAVILVVAAGVPNLILPQMVRTGAVVIDVGINRLPNGRTTGDVDFEGVRQKASLISPVPGGVGPMTVTMLLHNTLRAAERTISSAD